MTLRMKQMKHGAGRHVRAHRTALEGSHARSNGNGVRKREKLYNVGRDIKQVQSRHTRERERERREAW